MSDHHSGEPPSHRSKVGLGQQWLVLWCGGTAILPVQPSLPQPRGAGGTLPSQGPRLSYLGGLGGGVRFESATLEEPVLLAARPSGSFTALEISLEKPS